MKRKNPFAYVRVDYLDFVRWLKLAERLDAVTTAPANAARAFKVDPCRLRLEAFGNAVWCAAWAAEQPLRTEAVALAEEIDQRLFGGSRKRAA